MNQISTVSSVTRKFNTFGGWCGIFYFIFALLGWWIIAGFWPLHKPTASAGEITAFYGEGLLGIRLGLIIVMWTAVLMLIFTSSVASHISRIEGRSGPLTYCMLLGGYATAMLTFYPPLWWLTAAFRPDARSAELTYL